MPDPLETARVREVVGVVDSREALDSAVEQLLLAGVDRSRISLMGSREAILDKLHHYYVEPTPFADAGELPRRDVVTREDTTALTPLLFGTLLAVATLGATAVVASGGAVAAALAAAAGGGVLATTMARLLKHRILGDADPEALEGDIAMGGLLIFVQVTDSADEAKVEALLREHARNVHIHEVDVAKTLLDIPLGQIRRDPWLDDKSLAAP
jgi:hypothetical protein